MKNTAHKKAIVNRVIAPCCRGIIRRVGIFEIANSPKVRHAQRPHSGYRCSMGAKHMMHCTRRRTKFAQPGRMCTFKM